MACNNRQTAEDVFRSGRLMVMCATSTLSQGVNLPAHLVVIKSTQCYKGNTRGYTEYDLSMVMQMIGRAGRPQFDTTGSAVILTQTNTASRHG